MAPPIFLYRQVWPLHSNPMDPYKELERVVLEAFGPYGLTPQAIAALDVLLDNRFEGLIIVDAEGRVVFMNHENEKFIGLQRGEAKGRHITELIPSSRLHLVCKTGIPEVGHVQEIMGKLKVATRIPLKEGGSVIGAFGSIMFTDVKDLANLNRRVRVLEDQVQEYERKLKSAERRNIYTFDNILGEGAKLRDAIDLARTIAASDTDVVITGETGTGKELFAHAIHNASRRNNGPFVRVNCASIPRELAESELFGYEPGSFSGARKEGRSGKFEQAHGGTILLDEINELPLDIQAKLLRVLQEREVERIGATAVRYVDFRLITASNVDLKELTEQGRFRLDLYFRLNKMLLRVPALREHPEDIPFYARHFLDTRVGFTGGRPRAVAPDAMDALLGYSWPGNVRELGNVIERLAWNVKGPVIRLEDLPSGILTQRTETPAARPPMALKDTVEAAEKEVIKRVLELTRNNKSQACKLLDIHRTTLYEKLARYRLGTTDDKKV